MIRVKVVVERSIFISDNKDYLNNTIRESGYEVPALSANKSHFDYMVLSIDLADILYTLTPTEKRKLSNNTFNFISVDMLAKDFSQLALMNKTLGFCLLQNIPVVLHIN